MRMRNASAPPAGESVNDRGLENKFRRIDLIYLSELLPSSRRGKLAYSAKLKPSFWVEQTQL